MKLCFLSPASIVHTVRWVNAMVNRGHQVDLITMHKAKMDKIDERVRIHYLKLPAPFGYYLNRMEAKSLIKKIQPDILHVHFASGYGTLARFVNYFPTLLSVWGSDVYAFPDKSRRSEKVLRKNLKAPAHITSTSHAMRNRTEQFVIPKQPIDVIPFGIDLDLFKPEKVDQTDEIVIGTVKRLETIYGIDILLKATAKLIESLRKNNNSELAGKIRLKIVGDGSQLNELQQLAEELHIRDITEFSGAVENEMVSSQLNQLDIYCALSRRESFGVAVLEASSCEVPVIASDIEGLPEVIENGKTGYLVDKENLNDIVDKLMKLVIHRDLRERFGKNGRAFVSQYYDWQNNVTQMESVYSKIIEKMVTKAKKLRDDK